MNIGIIGAGNIGGNLALLLSKAGHQVKLANSRGPETINTQYLAHGAVPATQQEAVDKADVIIFAVPQQILSKFKPLLSEVKDDVIAVDTSNYYPALNGTVQELENNETQALWAQEQLGRPIVKAWNAVLSSRLAHPDGSAIPVAGDNKEAKKKVLELVKDSGFAAVDAGSLEEAWRFQPGSPAYCTALSVQEIDYALTSAQRDKLAGRRDLALSVIGDRAAEDNSAITLDYMIAVNRLVYRGEI